MTTDADDYTLSELGRTNQRIEAKLDTALSDHETRLRRLERFMWSATGIAAAIGSAVGSYIGRFH